MKKRTRLVLLAALAAFGIFETAFGENRTPFQPNETPFGRIGMAFGENETAKEFIQTPIGTHSNADSGLLDGIVKEKTYKITTPCCNIDMSYPQFEGSRCIFLNREIVKLINDMADVGRDEKSCEEMKSMNPDFKAEVSSVFTVFRDDKRFVSLYIETYYYGGGAHGMPSRIAYNISPKEGKNLTLGDMFKPGYDYATPINAFIMAQIAENPENYFPEGFKTVSDKTIFVVDSSHLHIIFPPYEIAPYSSGFPTFAIPLSDFGKNFLY